MDAGRGRSVLWHAPVRQRWGRSSGADTSPGVAATAYASVKCARHEDQPNFVPFIVETGGRVNRAGLHILDLLSGKASQTWPAVSLLSGPEWMVADGRQVETIAIAS